MRIFLRPERFGLVAGFTAIFVGGLIAAVTNPLQLRSGSWLAAYLVLVAGLAQLLLAGQRHLLATANASIKSQWWQLGCWFNGNLAVIIGSLTATPLLVDAGGVALIAALVLALLGTRTAKEIAPAWAARLFYVALALSIPIGLLLAHVRAT